MGGFTTAYGKLARLYHPDNRNTKNTLSKSESEEKFKELENAYDDVIEFFACHDNL